MREIKFRAWDKKRKKFVDWIEVYSDGTYNIGYMMEGGGLVRAQWGDCYDNGIDLLGKDETGKWNYERDSILMQYTGLKDKNGKEIYEGDIVKFDGHTFEDKFIAIIVFNNGMFRPEQWNEPLGNYKYLEIIGNVYENKDLLNETK